MAIDKMEDSLAPLDDQTVAWLLAAAATAADEQRPAREACSENGRYRLRLDVRHLGGGGGPRPRAALFERLVERDRERPVWRGTLVNDVAPVHVFVRNDGRFVVTLDESGRGGAVHALDVYDRRGRLAREFDLRELLRADDWKHVSVEHKAVNWLDGAQFAFADDPAQFVVELAWKRTIRIDLEKLKLVGLEPQQAGEELSAAVPSEVLALLNGQDSESTVEGRSDDDSVEVELEDSAELLRELASILGLDLDAFAEVDSTGDQTGRASEATGANAEAEAAVNLPTDAESDVQVVAEESPDGPAASESPPPQFAGNSAAAGWGVPMPDPRNPVDYVAWVMEQTVTDGPSAVPLYEAAFEQCYEFDGDWDLVEAGMLGDPDALASPEIAAYIEMHRDALASFHAAPQYEYRGMPDASGAEMVLDILLPSLARARHLAKMSVLQAKYLQANGDVGGAVDNYLSTLAVGAQMSQGATLIDNLVGIAIQSLAASRLLDSLATVSGDQLDYVQLAEGLDGRYRPLRPIAETYQGERACCLDVIQKLYRWEPETGTYAVSEEALQRIAVSFGELGGEPGVLDGAEMRGALETIGFENMVSEANGLYDMMTQAASVPYPEANSVWTELETRVGSAEFKERNPLLASMIPALSRSSYLATRAAAQRNATRLVANLQAYRQQYGTYPASLDAFGDADMTTDSFTGNRFVYRSDGGSFTLYSLGGNGVDDGGVHNPRGETNDVLYWPRQQK